MITTDARCADRRCAHSNIYRMVGKCYNCRTEPILILYTTTHAARAVECPTCGCLEVRPQRLATPDEIPAA